jgi:hypothetical protein
LHRAKAVRSTCLFRNGSREPFGEYARCALFIDTTKTSGAKSDLGNLILTRQIGEPAQVVAVNATAGLSEEQRAENLKREQIAA